MEISQFARQVLLGTTMADKLHRPETLTDLHPRALCAIPSRPGRPSGLELVEQSKNPKAFPTQAALAQPTARGLAFHFFANHELLALELMAVALIRFHDAPPAFRRQVAQAMLEEQEHLGAYLEHMPGYGVGFGDVSVSPFFWNALAGMASPLEYVAGMSLTFEQANLDFAARFRDAFAAVEDPVGAAVLQKVLDDEIGHVRVGVQWLRRWGDPKKTDFERHRDALVWPLHMARAKGEKSPLVEVRKKAGLSQAYIDALSCVRASKGRAPALWAFNPSYEREVCTHGAGSLPKGLRRVEEDLGFLISYLATPGDVVGVVRSPSMAYLMELQRLGLGEVELLTVPPWPGPWSKAQVGPQKLAGLHSWGPSQGASQVFAELVSRSVKPLPNDAEREAAAALGNKARCVDFESKMVEQLAEFGSYGLRCAGRVCDSLTSVQGVVTGPGVDSGQAWVIKAPQGTAGQQQIRVYEGQLTQAQEGWVKRVLGQQGQLRVEPWVKRAMDLSARFSEVQGGSRRLTGLTRMLCDARGGYFGHVLAPLGSGLDRARIEFLYAKGQDPRWIAKLFSRITASLSEEPLYRAYQGPLGIDALVGRDAQGFYLRPILEINARTTMGHVADALATKVLRSAFGIWVHLSIKDLQRAGMESFEDAGHCLPTQVEMRGQCISQGRLWTTDPRRAQSLGTLLLVGRGPEEAMGQLGALEPVIASKIEQGSGDFLVG